MKINTFLKSGEFDNNPCCYIYDLNKLKSIRAFSFSFFSIYINKPKEQKETENIIIEFIYLYELSRTIFEIPIRKLLTKNIKIIVPL